MQDGLRPLHCACKWGNIFGVQWLVTHGADVNVEEKVYLELISYGFTHRSFLEWTYAIFFCLWKFR